MPSSRPARDRAADTRERLLAAALRVFNRDGVAGASIHAICAEAGVSIGSTYHHFGSKQGLADALQAAGLRAHLESLRGRLPDPPSARASVTVLVDALIDWVQANPEWARFIYFEAAGRARGAAVQAVNSDYAAVVGEHSRPLIAAGALRRLPADSYASLVLGPTHDFARRALAGQTAADLDGRRALLREAAWRAVRPD